MFRCQSCGKVVPPGTTARKVVTSVRRLHYPTRPCANQGYRFKWHMRRRKSRRNRRAWEYVLLRRRSSDRKNRTDDPGGRGCEAVRELTVCVSCAERLQSAEITD